jgi:hypothetical protein
VLFQASQKLIEQIVELIGVIDKKRVPGILKKFKSRTGNTFLHLLKLRHQILGRAHDQRRLVDFRDCRPAIGCKRCNPMATAESVGVASEPLISFCRYSSA